MTRIIVLLAVLILQHTNTIAEKKFILHGRLSEKAQGTIYLRYSKGTVMFLDSITLKSDSFSFSGMLAEPVYAKVIYKSKTDSKKQELYVDFLIEPGELNLSIDMNNPQNNLLKGSKTNTEYQLLRQGSDQIIAKYYSLKYDLENDSVTSSTLPDSILYFRNQGEIFLKKFINEHSTSYSSAYAMRRRIDLQDIGPDSSLKLMYSLDPNVQRGSVAQKSIRDFEATLASAVGHEAPEFSRLDVNGKEISLKNLRGKYVLLEYWASWCLPCRALTPEMKDFYNKYHDKGFEIVYISCDSKYNDWRKAVADDKVESFINVLSFTDKDMEFLKTRDNMFDASFTGELRKMYNLMPIPSEILIDPAGTIIGRYRGLNSEPGEKLGIKMKEIFPSAGPQ